MACFFTYVILIWLTLVTDFIMMLWEIQQFGGYTKILLRLSNCGNPRLFTQKQYFPMRWLEIHSGVCSTGKNRLNFLRYSEFSFLFIEVRGNVRPYHFQWSKISFGNPWFSILIWKTFVLGGEWSSYWQYYYLSIFVIFLVLSL